MRNNKVALVTGAGSGMWPVTAEAFEEAGAAVVFADIDEDAVGSAAAVALQRWWGADLKENKNSFLEKWRNERD